MARLIRNLTLRTNWQERQSPTWTSHGDLSIKLIIQSQGGQSWKTLKVAVLAWSRVLLLDCSCCRSNCSRSSPCVHGRRCHRGGVGLKGRLRGHRWRQLTWPGFSRLRQCHKFSYSLGALCAWKKIKCKLIWLRVASLSEYSTISKLSKPAKLQICYQFKLTYQSLLV